MTVYELAQEQLDELKSAYFWSEDTQEALEGSGIDFPEDIPDEVIFREYEDIYFVNDDFFCTCYLNEEETA